VTRGFETHNVNIICVCVCVWGGGGGVWPAVFLHHGLCTVCWSEPSRSKLHFFFFFFLKGINSFIIEVGLGRAG